MEEYEIRDVGNREESPRLEVISKIDNKEFLLKSHGHPQYSIVDLRLNLVNQSFEPAPYAYIHVQMPKELHFVDSNIESKVFDDVRKHMYIYGSLLGQPPIIQGIELELKFSRIMVPYLPLQEIYPIFWEIHSPKMTSRKGIVVLDCFKENDKCYCSVITQEWKENEQADLRENRGEY
jgi:hypothetical protein